MSAAPTVRRSAPRDLHWVEWFRIGVEAILLNALWLVGCVLVVTAPAATSALVAAVHRWRTAHEAPTARRFLRDVRTRFWRDLVAGAGMAVVGAVAALDLVLIGRMGDERRVVLVLWLAVLVAVALATVFLPVASARAAESGGAQPTPWASTKTAARIAVRHPFAAALSLLVALASVALVTASPICLLVIGVAAAALVDRLAEGRRPRPERPIDPRSRDPLHG